MRTLRDLDDQIGRAERRLAARREHLNLSLASSRRRTRVSLASPKVVAAAFVAGFLLERVTRMRPKKAKAPHQGSGASGIVAGLAAAALKAALGNPKVWESVRGMWSRRKPMMMGGARVSSTGAAPVRMSPSAPGSGHRSEINPALDESAVRANAAMQSRGSSQRTPALLQR
jgi:hypothetical protein